MTSGSTANGVRVMTQTGPLGLGYFKDPVVAAKLRDMAVVHFKTGEALNYPELIETYKVEAESAIQFALANKVHGKRAA